MSFLTLIVIHHFPHSGIEIALAKQLEHLVPALGLNIFQNVCDNQAYSFCPSIPGEVNVSTSIDGRDYYVRQIKDLKASIPVELLTGASFDFYAWCCGVILARAHSRTGDLARIAGYRGKSTVLDEALAEWAESYADQTERDHSLLVKAVPIVA